MTLAQLRYFQAVCKHSNITKAAAEVGISQPSISNAMKELEEELGLKLFHRLNKGLILTKEGQYFNDKSGGILEQLDELTSHMRHLSSQQKELKIGVPPMAGAFLFPYMFQQFRLAYPNIGLNILENGSIHTRDLVADGTLDAAIVATPPNNSGDNSIFESTSIMNMETLFCVSEQHALAFHTAVTIGAIKNEPLVLFKEDSFQTHMLKKLFQRYQAMPNVILHSNQLHTIKELVANGIACSVLFQGVLGPNEGIVGIPFQEPLLSTIRLIWNKQKPLHGDLASFIDFTREYEHHI